MIGDDEEGEEGGDVACDDDKGAGEVAVWGKYDLEDLVGEGELGDALDGFVEHGEHGREHEEHHGGGIDYRGLLDVFGEDPDRAA